MKNKFQENIHEFVFKANKNNTRLPILRLCLENSPQPRLPQPLQIFNNRDKEENRKSGTVLLKGRFLTVLNENGFTWFYRKVKFCAHGLPDL